MAGGGAEVSEMSSSTEIIAPHFFFAVDWPGSLSCQRSGLGLPKGIELHTVYSIDDTAPRLVGHLRRRAAAGLETR